MSSWLLLLHPSHNRLYASQSVQLAYAELCLASRAWGDALHDIAPTAIGAAPAMSFGCDLPGETLSARMARLACAYLLFRREGEAFYPQPLARLSPLEEDLISILKYTGKTNEDFTRLLVNAALFASDFALDAPAGLRLLDPLCGRGTTLFEGLLQGQSVGGIELDKKSAEAGLDYFQRYLQQKRWKHQYAPDNITDQRGTLARRHLFTLAPDKERYRRTPQTLDWVCGDTLKATRYWPTGHFQLLAADLPYGVQHASTQKGERSRSPEALLEAALPGWLKLLAPGGGLALSWNSFTLKRETLEALLRRAGLELIPTEDFEHRVEQAIKRDLIAARKPAAS